MPKTSDIKLTIAFTDPNLEADEKDAEVARLLIQMRELKEVKTVSLVTAPDPTQSERILSQFVVGTLVAEVFPEGIWIIFGFLRDQLLGKGITLTLGMEERTLTVNAQTAPELETALQSCEDFLVPIYDSQSCN
jgi:hypothetical protein